MSTSPIQPAATTPESPAPPGMPDFTRSRGGYHTGQVHHYVAVLLDRIHELEGALHHPRGEVMYTLEEPQGHELIADLMRLATNEIEGKQAAAAAEAADVLRRATQDAETKLAGATAQATSILAGAEKEAQSLVAGAREQADTVLSTAHAQAKTIVDQSSAHAAAVDEGAQRRLGNMTGTHEETIRRLTEIHNVTGQVLEADAGRGSLQEEVDKATTALAIERGDEPLKALPQPPGDSAA